MKKSEGLINPDKTTPYYQCRFYIGPGKRTRLSTGESDYHAAWHAYQALRKSAGLPPDIDGSHTLGSVLAEYELDALKRLKSRHGHDTSIAALYRFWAPDTPWQNICSAKGKQSINEYKRWREDVCAVKSSTIRRELSVLSAAAEHGIRQGADIRNPRNMIKIRIAKTDYYYLTREQARPLLDACQQSPSAGANQLALHDFVKISLYTGMRTGEVLQLTTDRVSFVHQYVYLHDSKAGKPHAVPISEEIIDCLERRMQWARQHNSPFLFVNPRTGKPVKSFISPFKRACKVAGIPVNKKGSTVRGMRVYDLRHTFATWLVQGGASIERVADLLNHADIKMTQVYAHHSPTGRASTIKILPSL